MLYLWFVWRLLQKTGLRLNSENKNNNGNNRRRGQLNSALLPKKVHRVRFTKSAGIWCKYDFNFYLPEGFLGASSFLNGWDSDLWTMWHSIWLLYINILLLMGTFDNILPVLQGLVLRIMETLLEGITFIKIDRVSKIRMGTSCRQCDPV